MSTSPGPRAPDETGPQAAAPRDDIAVMDAALADQIAAGEVVERPGSVVKELVDNAVDAGASRVDVRIEEGGKKLISVLDDGRGIVPGQLRLALTRHATSKVRRADELVELPTLGFRGEALASISAVARVHIRSRRTGADKGWELRVDPGQVAGAGEADERPVGMAEGTEVRIEHLFSNVPARRKFLRSEATEVGHCVDAVLKTALVHPTVRFSLRHGARELLKFPAGTLADRVGQVLARRGQGPYLEVNEELEGVRVRGWFAHPSHASRQRGGAFVVVRRRVVKERSLANAVTQAYASTVPSGLHAVYCLWVEPAAGTVDVNVHPQKSEVRFSDPQRVYAAVRRVLSTAFAEAPWSVAAASPVDEGPAVGSGSRVSDALSAWDDSARRTPVGKPFVAGGRGPTSGASSTSRYRLGTRATQTDYAQQKFETRSQVAELRTRFEQARQGPQRDESDDSVSPASAQASSDAQPIGPSLLGVLEGPVALFEHEGALWAVDLRRLRGFLLLRRLQNELGGSGIVAQGLLPALTVTRPREEVALIARRNEDLRTLGMEVEAFGDDAVIVRAVPAAMTHCRDEASAAELLDQTIPWLRLREQQATAAERKESSASEGATAGLAALASVRGQAPAARFARRWLADAMALAPLESLPGVERWTVAQLMRR